MADYMKHAIWAVAIMTSIVVIAEETSKANIEESKQTAFMMKACVDAGGQWTKTWSPRYECLRPGAH